MEKCDLMYCAAWTVPSRTNQRRAARPLLIAEGYWLAAQYEPRISFNGIDVDGMPELGNYDLTANGTI